MRKPDLINGLTIKEILSVEAGDVRPIRRYITRLEREVYKNCKVKADNLRDLRKKRKSLSKKLAFSIMQRRFFNRLIVLRDEFMRRQVKTMEE